MRVSVFVLTMFLLVSCKSYDVEVQPPDCVVNEAQQECQDNQIRPVNDRIDQNPEDTEISK